MEPPTLVCLPALAYPLYPEQWCAHRHSLLGISIPECQRRSIQDQIVWYNNDHNLQFRLFSMPIDDLIYGFLMIAMTIIGYEIVASKMGLVTGSTPGAQQLQNGDR